MCANIVYSVDRLEGDKAILIAEDHSVCVVPLTDLPDVKAGNVYRRADGCFVRDTVAEAAKKERISRAQKRILQSK